MVGGPRQSTTLMASVQIPAPSSGVRLRVLPMGGRCRSWGPKGLGPRNACEQLLPLNQTGGTWLNEHPDSERARRGQRRVLCQLNTCHEPGHRARSRPRSSPTRSGSSTSLHGSGKLCCLPEGTLRVRWQSQCGHQAARPQGQACDTYSHPGNRVPLPGLFGMQQVSQFGILPRISTATSCRRDHFHRGWSLFLCLGRHLS